MERKLRVAVVTAPNFHVQPVCICPSYDEAVEAAHEYMEIYDTSTEVWEFLLGDVDDMRNTSYINTYRCLSPQDGRRIKNAKKILDKYFPENHPEYEDYEHLAYNQVSCPDGLTFFEAHELRRFGFVVELGTIYFKFYRHNFKWDRLG